MRRYFALSLACAAALSATACSGTGQGDAAGRHGGTPSASRTHASAAGGDRNASADRRSATPRTSRSAHDKLLAAASAHMLEQNPPGTHNTPGPRGMFEVNADQVSVLFIWETPDNRFCSGSDTADGGWSTTTCTAHASDTAYAPKPALMNLGGLGWASGANYFFGVDREALREVTCNGRPVPYHQVITMAGGRRPVYAFVLPAETGGSVTLTVTRGRTTAKEHIKLLFGPSSKHPTCT